MHGRVEPTRITLARRLKGWTQKQLASSLTPKTSLGTVSLWESGQRDASHRIGDIAEELGQTVDFFSGSEVPITPPEAVSFRKRHDATRKVRDRAAAIIDTAAGVLTPAIRAEFGRLPDVSLPSYPDLDPACAADALREEWGLSPAPLRNVVEQLEARGVRVFWTSVEDKALSAFCKWVNDEPFVVLTTSRKDGCRSRFDACHELAHLVCDRDTDFDVTDIKTIERRADAFASAFLLPRDPFLEDAPRSFDLDRFLELKKIWKVSVQCMVRRLFDLGVFSPWQYEQAFRHMSSLGWRREPEPWAGQLEMSRIHWRLCDRLEERDDLPERFAEYAHLDWKTTSELMPVLKVRQQSLSFDGLFSDSPAFEIESPDGKYM